MINSMTGYGSATGECDGVTYVVEIRTVNNRFFKTRIKLPEPVVFLEEDIESVLRQQLSRGMVNYILHIKNVSSDVFFDIDEKALQSYVERLSRIARGVDVSCSIDIGNLLGLPEVFSPRVPDEAKAGRVRETVLKITTEALAALKQMRAAEGVVLAEDLAQHCNQIEDKLGLVRQQSESFLTEYAKRLKKRIEELLGAGDVLSDEEIVAREVAVFAERSDISEEIVRLQSHIEQFRETCEGKGGSGQAGNQSGRRLDFISQEMLREANTIASKACDAKTIHLVVDIKCLIDRIKEQVQNVE
jgi:uncharacterized protein (TIGR00255 family)